MRHSSSLEAQKRAQHKHLDKNREKRYAENRRYQQSIKNAAYAKLGNKCSNPACQWLNPDGSRGCTDLRCLQVDHVFGGGCNERKILKCSREIYRKVIVDTEGLYQLLCANCNWIKRGIRGETARPRFK